MTTKSWTETNHKQRKVASHYAEALFARAKEEHLGKFKAFFLDLQRLHKNGVVLTERQVKALRNIVAFSLETARKKALARTPLAYEYEEKLNTIYNPIKR